MSPYLGAEGEVVAQGGDVVLQQVDEALVEVIVLALHVRVPGGDTGGVTGGGHPTEGANPPRGGSTCPFFGGY